jgi:hypothetical protein
MIWTTIYHCTALSKWVNSNMNMNKGLCDTALEKHSETSVSNQSCIKYNPSVSASYSRVQFRDPFSLESSNEFMLDSLIFSHMYMKAASDCEFYVSLSRTSCHSCQALANLCVLGMYDQDTPACKQLEGIFKNEWNLITVLPMETHTSMAFLS